MNELKKIIIEMLNEIEAKENFLNISGAKGASSDGKLATPPAPASLLSVDSSWLRSQPYRW